MAAVRRHRRSRLVASSSAGLLAAGGLVFTASPAAADPACATAEALLECVTAEGLEEHLRAFQAIADGNGGTRASGTAGYTESADYVEQRLEDAGYQVTRQGFDFTYYQLVGTPTFTTGTTSRTYGEDFLDMEYSGSGAVTGAGVQIDPDSGSSGCEASDFAGLDLAGKVAVIERGTCSFGTKATNAEGAGAAAVVIFNDGASADRMGLIGGTLGEPVGIPVLDTTNAIGETLGGVTMAVDIETVSEVRTTENVIAELPGKTKHDVVMVGAHLDSVAEGPGINDNGTGSAAVLEVAESLAGVRFQHPVRFAWWGAEESGLIGSQYYVDSLTQGEINRLAAYLNFDMLGSVNHVNFVYDGDGSTFPAPEGFVTPDSAAIEGVFEGFYDRLGLPYEDTEFDGRSDYEAFALAGVPSGGLFSGAEGIKTIEQQTRYGGTAGTAYDPCYHQACDTLANVDLGVLAVNADAVAYAVATLADTHDLGGGAGGGNAGGNVHGGHGGAGDQAAA